MNINKFTHQLIRYFTRTQYVFKKGLMKFSIQGNVLTICYYRKEERNSFSRKIKIQDNYKQVIEEIQDFCLDCYFENERDGSKVYKKDIADILGVDEMKVKNIMRNVFKKIRVNAEQLL